MSLKPGISCGKAYLAPAIPSGKRRGSSPLLAKILGGQGLPSPAHLRLPCCRAVRQVAGLVRESGERVHCAGKVSGSHGGGCRWVEEVGGYNLQDIKERKFSPHLCPFGKLFIHSDFGSHAVLLPM